MKKSDAELACKDRNSWLVEIKDKDTNGAVVDLMSGEGKADYWIGLKHDDTVDGWFWNDGTPLGYSNWNSGEPDSENEDCVVISKSSAKWADISCNNAYGRRYICQSDANSFLIFALTTELVIFAYDESGSERKISFSEANTACDARESELVLIKTQKLDQALDGELTSKFSSYASGENRFWTSGNDKAVEGTWVWGDEAEFTHTNWDGNGIYANEPNGGKDENCLVKGENSWKWKDISCTDNYPYICQRDISSGFCSPDICSNHGMCWIIGSRYNCSCDIGWWGSKCEKECPCVDGKICLGSPNVPYYTCSCPTLHGGNECEDCLCLNGGTCPTTPADSCSCPSVSEGPLCENCLCQNGGTCTTTPADSCSCPSVSEGPLCENCLCLNGGTCRTTPADSCSCPPPYEGTLCENCLCLNGGTCRTTPADSCSCRPPYEGTLCENCLCQNGGTCPTTPADSCSCPTVSVGTLCQNCLCQNGGTCPTTPADSCSCPPSYEGTFCKNRAFYTNDDGTCQYHINYDDKVKQETARSICNQTLSGSLAMVKDQSTHDFLCAKANQAYSSDTVVVTRYWIGGENISNEWKWFDSTEIPVPPTDDFQRWGNGRPSDNGPCMIMTNFNSDDFFWVEKNCAETQGYICEVAVTDPCETCKNRGGKCHSVGCQCVCDAGYFDDFCDKAYGPPHIISAKAKDCSPTGEVNITWIPDNDTVCVRHICEITNLNSTKGIVTQRMSLNISESGDQVLDLNNLSASSLYDITIIVCPRECVEELKDSTQVMTGIGLPDEVKEAKIHKTGEANCVVTWSWPDSPRDQIQSFELTSYSSLHRVPNGGDAQDDKETYSIEAVENLEFLLVTRPNLEYVVYIEAQTCAGRGESRRANGFCVTESDAPQVVPPPDVSAEYLGSTREIVVILPDETNGVISCMFVIVKLSDNSSINETFGIENLQSAEEAALGSALQNGSEYTAIAIQRSHISGSNYVTYIGDDSLTSCDVSSIGTTQRRQNNEYLAKNWPLEDGKSYSYFTVTTTPTNDEIKFQQSEAFYFKNSPVLQTGLKNWIIPVATVLILAFVGVVVFAVIYCIRRSKESKTLKKNVRTVEGPRLDGNTNYDNTCPRDGDKEGYEMVTSAQSYDNTHVKYDNGKGYEDISSTEDQNREYEISYNAEGEKTVYSTISFQSSEYDKRKL